MRCQCCGGEMHRGDPEEPLFCWLCGLYEGDEIGRCDVRDGHEFAQGGSQDA